MKKTTLKICVSGAAAGDCMKKSAAKARAVGREIAKQKAVLVTGATTGLPYEASKGAKSVKGVVIGFSPASTPKEHVKKFKLPGDYMDLVVYTGADYAGRNLILTRSSDAVIIICGRIGTLNEFTIAFEDKKLIGVLTDSGGIADEIPHLLNVAKRGKSKIIFDSDPKTLVKKIIKYLKENNGYFYNTIK